MQIGDVFLSITPGEWLTLVAALSGPILAVQAQKLVEAGRAKRLMKDDVFRRLMATRAARLSPEHVQALNMIDIAFYGRRVLGFRFQNRGEKAVCRSWREYLNELLPATGLPLSEAQENRLGERRVDKFFVLLGSMAKAQQFDFEELELRNNSYIPIAHGQIEAEHDAIRGNLAKVLTGESPLKMEVVNLPKNETQNLP